MEEIEIGVTPVDIGAALGLPTTGRGSQRWRIQNRGPNTVYKWRSATTPDITALRGIRHPAGALFPQTVYTADLGALWAWTSQGTSTLVCESGDY